MLKVEHIGSPRSAYVFVSLTSSAAIIKQFCDWCRFSDRVGVSFFADFMDLIEGEPKG